MNGVSVRLDNEPKPTGQRAISSRLLFPFGNRHFSGNKYLGGCYFVWVYICCLCLCEYTKSWFHGWLECLYRSDMVWVRFLLSPFERVCDIRGLVLLVGLSQAE